VANFSRELQLGGEVHWGWGFIREVNTAQIGVRCGGAKLARKGVWRGGVELSRGVRGDHVEN